MINRQELVIFLDMLLSPSDIKDNTVNGLQFEGSENIHHIACAVDISLDVFKKAAELNVDFLFTHHGMIWGGINQITGLEKKRLEVLFQNNINVYCSHLPLDIHKTLGNNAIIIDLLNAQMSTTPFFDVGYVGIFSPPITYRNLKTIIEKEISNQIVELPFGPSEIRDIAVCSGGATLNVKSLFEAYNKGIHTILSGETNSLLYHYAKELKVNVICAGHYTTEVFGVQAILQELEKKYGEECCYTFIDIPTGF